ncbi:MAG: electron transfer flavoprotein subunit alpha/FixB family protein, partial [Bacillota bacterium]
KPSLDHPTKISYRDIKPQMLQSGIRFVSIEPKLKEVSITEADILVAVGRGLKKAEDLNLIEELAQSLGAMVAVTRPLVELGWAPQTRQVGLSGRTVRPKLFIACGISGAIQHVAGMSSSDFIIAINKDKTAPIFDTCHFGLVGDMYEILPLLIKELREVKTLVAESRWPNA